MQRTTNRRPARSCIAPFAFLIIVCACGAESGTSSTTSPRGAGAPGAGSGGGSSNNRIVLWTSSTFGPPIALTTPAGYLGTITTTFASAPPCDAAGAVTFLAPTGPALAVTGTNETGLSWQFNVGPSTGCTTKELTVTTGILKVSGGYGSGKLGGGTARSVSGAIACTVTNGVEGATGCTSVRPSGTLYTITATPNPGDAFEKWINCDKVTGSVCDVVVNGVAGVKPSNFVDKEITAVFRSPRQVDVSIVIDGIAGLVAYDIWSCEKTRTAATAVGRCVVAALPGDTLRLTAKDVSINAVENATFSSWNGCASASNRQCVLIVTGSTTVAAKYTFYTPIVPQFSVGVWSSTDGVTVAFDNQTAGLVPAVLASAPASCTAPGVLLIKTSQGTHSISARSNKYIWDNRSVGVFDTCILVALTPQNGTAVGGGGGTGGGGGGTGGTGGITYTPEPNSGTNVAACQTGLRQVGEASQAWQALPAPFAGLDYKIYYSTFFAVYQIAFRNRYVDYINFNFGPLGGSVLSRTNYRETIKPGLTSGTVAGITVPGSVTGGRGCVLVNRVRFGVSDSGPYR